MAVRLAQRPMNPDLPVTNPAAFVAQEVAMEFAHGHICDRYRAEGGWYECGHGHSRYGRKHLHTTTTEVGGERR